MTEKRGLQRGGIVDVGSIRSALERLGGMRRVLVGSGPLGGRDGKERKREGSESGKILQSIGEAQDFGRVYCGT